MKKVVLLLSAAALCLGVQARSFDMKILPDKAQRFLVETFPTHTIRYIESEAETGVRQTYQVVFTDGCEVEFDKAGMWTKIDCGDTPVPLSAIPESVQNYVAMHNNQATFVTEIERNKRCYEVELNNGTEYTLNHKGMTCCDNCDKRRGGDSMRMHHGHPMK